MRELETALQQFGEFLLRARLVTPRAAPYCVRWVRRFLSRAATDEPLADQARRFCEGLERDERREEWQGRQAEYALRLYFVNFLQRTNWHRTDGTAAVGANGTVNALLALEQMRRRLQARHYAYRTEASYIDWARRFLAHLAKRHGQPEPHVDTAGVQDFLTHLAVERRVSSSSQNQALSALLFLCREALGMDVGDLSQMTRARRGSHLPVVLSVPETAALLGALRGRAWLMAALIYGGGLRVSECCELRIKDVDFDQGLLIVRHGKGNKDRTTLLAETGREALTAQLKAAKRCFEADRQAGVAGVWLPDALDRKYPNASRELGWFWVSRVTAASAAAHRTAARSARQCGGGLRLREPGRRRFPGGPPPR